ncbi:hypothetical protein MUG91_G30n90 [Manis pentadactyla]|nr:hypothetical protein MUG91_G30n90 [Manis pentadactyla]
MVRPDATFGDPLTAASSLLSRIPPLQALLRDPSTALTACISPSWLLLLFTLLDHGMQNIHQGPKNHHMVQKNT